MAGPRGNGATGLTRRTGLDHQVKARFVVTFAEHPSPDLPKGTQTLRAQLETERRADNESARTSHKHAYEEKGAAVATGRFRTPPA